MEIKNITGFEKHLFNLKIRLKVFGHFIPEIRPGKLSLKNYFLFLSRLSFFLSKLQHNKFVRIGRYTRVDLYIPGATSEAFYTACRKFMVFGEKLPAITVLLSVTSACRFRCEHCYQRKDLGQDVDIEKMVTVVKRLQDLGIAFFNIEGGEPFLAYERLKRVCQAIDQRSEIWVNSTGDSMTLARLKELKKLNLTAVMFSLHSPFPEELNRFMRSDRAWETMIRGVGLCHEADLPVAFNICLLKKDFENGVFEKLMDTAKKLGAAIVQLIKPKPAGGWLESGIDQFDLEDLERIKGLVNTYNLNKAYRAYPSISAQIIEEDSRMFGCTAGGTDRFYINAKGDVQPCEFLNLSFGNIGVDDFDHIYQAMRKEFEIPGEDWLCEKYHQQILKIFNEEQLKTLPLNQRLSRKVYQKWDRGKPTALYQKIEHD